MPAHFPMMISSSIKPATSIEIRAPWDLSLIATVDCGNQDAVEDALRVAHALFSQRQHWLPKTERITILENTATLMAAQAEMLALEAAREGGKPLVDSKVEIIRAIDSIRLCADSLRQSAGEVIPMNRNAASQGKHAFTIAEPIGVVVAISAFNHPLNLIAHQVGPAIAAGCPVIIKPAEDTPLSCFRLVSLLRQAGLPDGWCQALLTENNDVSTLLVSDERVGFLSFIGSAKVGWMLRSKLAAGTRCALEHGGIAPVIVAEDADMAATLPKLLKGAFYHAGQVCVSVQRIFVHHTLARQLATDLAKQATALRLGDPTLPETDIGPLIRPAEVARVAAWVDEAVQQGAEMLCGGKALSNTSYACTVLLNPSAQSRISHEEIFGPVVCIYPYQDLDEAIALANATPWIFQASVFTDNLTTARYAAANLDASAVMINDHTAFRVDWMPFAGLRHSGLGVGGIPYTFHDMQVQKLIVIS